MRTCLGLLLTLPLVVPAQDRKPFEPPLIRTTAEATVTANPDRARLELGVITQAQTADAAAAQNATKLDAVLRELKKAAGPGAEVRTVGYSVTPNYNYPREGGKPTIANYTAANVVQVTTDDIAAVGKLIDAGTRAGGNTVRRLQFMLKDPQQAHAQALKEATAKARASADAIAAALGVKIVRVLAAEAAGPQGPVRPFEPMMMARAEAGPAPSTPIEAGSIEVQASVTLTLEIGQ